jgi:histidinol-phosphate aminotransferase
MQRDNQSYRPPEYDGEVQLALNRNESDAALSEFPVKIIAGFEQRVCRYPSFEKLQNSIANWIGSNADQVVVTNGGDEGIDRVIRNCLNSGKRKLVTHSPSFEMFDIYSHNAGGEIEKVDWLDGEFPVQQFVDAIDEQTALAIVVSPNNPTGLVVSTEDLKTIAGRCREVGCKLLVDLAYVEFSATDPTRTLMELPGVFLIRTFSKAWGLAGLRVGYVVASDAAEAQELRALAGPFPVSGVSLETARQSLESACDSMTRNLERVKSHRSQVKRLVTECGGEAFDSQGNFVFAKFSGASELWQSLAENGVGVRKFASPELSDFLRITVPVKVANMLHLARAMTKATACEFDLSKIVGSEELSAVAAAPIAESESTDSAQPTELSRRTKETDILIRLELRGEGKCDISTGIGFLDHMLTALAFHSRMNLDLKCKGDLHIDDHHTAEDCALALGTAISDALGERKGIKRFGYAYAPLDEGLARTVLDLSGRPWPEIHLDLKREMIGTIAAENLTHFFQSLAMTLKCSLHVDVLRGDNDHHKAEAAFKSLALALKAAISPSGNDIPSTKGVL